MPLACYFCSLLPLACFYACCSLLLACFCLHLALSFKLDFRLIRFYWLLPFRKYILYLVEFLLILLLDCASCLPMHLGYLLNCLTNVKSLTRLITCDKHPKRITVAQAELSRSDIRLQICAFITLDTVLIFSASPVICNIAPPCVSWCCISLALLCLLCVLLLFWYVFMLFAYGMFD